MARRFRRPEMPTFKCCSTSICPCWLRHPIGIGAYAQAIRQEYAAVPDELYRPGRRRVLEGFLARPQIYLTERLRALWEAPARANLSERDC